jgi:hypothetical protein
MSRRDNRQRERNAAATTGPMIQRSPASSRLRLTDTSADVSAGTFGLGRRGGSPGGTSLMSKARGSENGLEVYKCFRVERRKTRQLFFFICRSCFLAHSSRDVSFYLLWSVNNGSDEDSVLFAPLERFVSKSIISGSIS